MQWMIFLSQSWLSVLSLLQSLFRGKLAPVRGFVICITSRRDSDQLQTYSQSNEMQHSLSTHSDQQKVPGSAQS
jgi:hypothetical protein